MKINSDIGDSQHDHFPEAKDYSKYSLGLKKSILACSLTAITLTPISSKVRLTTSDFDLKDYIEQNDYASPDDYDVNDIIAGNEELNSPTNTFSFNELSDEEKEEMQFLKDYQEVISPLYDDQLTI